MDDLFTDFMKLFDGKYSKKELSGNEHYLWICVRLLMINSGFKELMDLFPLLEDFVLGSLILKYLGCRNTHSKIPGLNQFYLDIAKNSVQQIEGLMVQCVHLPDTSCYLELLDRNLDTTPIPITYTCKVNRKVVEPVDNKFLMHCPGVYEVFVGNMCIWRGSHCIELS